MKPVVADEEEVVEGGLGPTEDLPEYFRWNERDYVQ